MPKSKRKSSGNAGGDSALAKRLKASNTNESSNGDAALNDQSIFGQLVTKAGLVLKKKKSPILTKDQALFQKSLKALIKKHPEFPEVVEQFVESFSEHFTDPVRLHLFLSPCGVAIDNESLGTCSPDSLVRLLLSIDEIQPILAEKLLEKLAEIAEERPTVEGVGTVNMPHLIMNQFRWLDNIVKSQDLVEKMFEIISITPPDAQAEIITCLPEVIDDSQHFEVTQKLCDLLNENNQLAVPILDALTILDVKADLLLQVRTSVVRTLPSVAVDDLPVIVKFLLQSFASSEAVEAVTELRENLDLQSLVKLAKPKSSSSKSSSKSIHDIEVLIVDAIKTAARFQRTVSEAWLKSIDKHGGQRSLQLLDVLVLCVLHSIGWKKPVESLVRNKIRSGALTVQLFQEMVSLHTQVSQEYFPAVLRIAEVLLRSPEHAISLFACGMYEHAFIHFDVYCRQEIVSTLVTHIGSGSLTEVDGSFNVLLRLSLEHSQNMSSFGVFIKGILDYVANLNLGQIRKLYCMLSHLAFAESQDDNSLQDEMHIIIRKQLSCNDVKYQRMGVVGAVMVIKELAQCSSGGDLREDLYQMVINLLQLVHTAIGQVPLAFGLFLDELASIIHAGKIHPKVEAWIADNVISDFQDEFISDLDPQNKEGSVPLPWTVQYGLDEESEGAIAINMVQLLAANSALGRSSNAASSKTKLPSALCLAAQFRLLHICESKQHDGDLEGVDALLGCALMLPETEIIDKLGCMKESERQLCCQCLFLVLNWFRELLNAFCGQSSPEMKAKVITRLHNITALHQQIEKALTVVPEFLPPQVNFDVDHLSAPLTATSVQKRVPKAPKKGRKKKKEETVGNDSDESRDSSHVEEPTQPSNEDSTSAEASAADQNQLSFAKLRPYLRELDLGVFNILKTGMITRAAYDSEMQTKDTTTLQIQPAQMIFLLEDLVCKQQHSLLASIVKRQSFFKSKSGADIGFAHLEELSSLDVAKFVIDLLPTLCDHLEGANGFFQTLHAASDGIMDSHVFNTEESHQMARCFHLLLQSLLSLFTWVGFSGSENRTLLKAALSVLASRLNSSLNSQSSLDQLLRQAFTYVENFASVVPHLQAAITLCRILVCFEAKSESDDLIKKICEMSESMLKRKWHHHPQEKNQQINEQLQILLKIYFEHSQDVLSILETICSVAIPELFETDKNGCSNEFCTLTRSSYGLYYRVMLKELVDSVTSLQAAKPRDPSQVKVDRLLQWNRAVRIFHILVNLVKVFEGRANLGSILKWGRQFLEVFLRQCMPMLDHVFVAHKDDVQSLLKNLQLSTRSLQHMCSHSKFQKNGALVNHVPLLKKTLEMFVYRVKAMLTMNQCLEAFWLGNLKNRDLQGEEIISQSSRNTQDNSDDDDDIPDDDDQESDIDIDEGNEKGAEVSNTETDAESRDGESMSEVF